MGGGSRGDGQWYKDQFTGKSMDRKGWNRLMDNVRAGKVGTVVVWRLDRLGRTAKGLTALFEELLERKVTPTALCSARPACPLVRRWNSCDTQTSA